MKTEPTEVIVLNDNDEPECVIIDSDEEDEEDIQGFKALIK